jgi:hypothetical protein
LTPRFPSPFRTETPPVSKISLALATAAPIKFRGRDDLVGQRLAAAKNGNYRGLARTHHCSRHFPDPPVMARTALKEPINFLLP